jgi:hypothetical protein
MNDFNELSLTTNFVYLLQTPNPTQIIPVTSWILDNTSSISSGLAVITLALALLSVQLKANIYRHRKIKRQRAEEIKSQRLLLSASLSAIIDEKSLELQRAKFINNLRGADRDNLVEFIEAAKQLGTVTQEVQIERKDVF